MKQKFELGLTESYARQWGVQEALRELLQNAIDQEVQASDNKMSIGYDGNNKLSICNKSSELLKKTLLLGYTSKENNDQTIGQFGEGYKIALLVLTRLGKKVTIYNYSKREVWTSRLVKSRRFDGEKVLTVFVENEYIWKKVPNENLTIEIEGIDNEIYKELISRSLVLQTSYKKNMLESEQGQVLLDDKFKGKVFVNGLYISNIQELEYGYNINPKHIRIGRDRDLVSDYDIFSVTSSMWKSQLNFRLKELIKKGSRDVCYITNTNFSYEDDDKVEEIGEEVYKDFIEEHGTMAIPVTCQTEVDIINKEYENAKPVVVNEIQKKLITDLSSYKTEVNSFSKSELNTKDRYEMWKEKNMYKILTGTGLNELDDILKNVL